MKVVKFLGSGLMEPMEVALLLVVAAADTRDDDYAETIYLLLQFIRTLVPGFRVN